MTTDGIVQYMKSFQIGPEKTTDTILSPDNLSIQLVGRDNTLAEIADIFETSYQYQVEGIPDRTKKIIPLITSIPGMGKTRLLYEWKNFIPRAANDDKILPIIFSYGNGHSPTATEKCLSPESSLCWRILFAFFLERFNGGKLFQDLTSPELPENIVDLRLKHVLSVIRSFYDVSMRLVIFLGIDEYQVIRKLPQQGEISALTTLLELLVNSMSREMVILPLLAGTAFSSASGSSGAVCRYVPLRLLSSKEVFSAIRSIKETKQLLSHAPARRHLFSLGGVPRYFVNYVGRVLKEQKITMEVMNGAFQHVQTVWVDFWNSHFNSSQLVKLMAHSLSGQSVGLADCPEGFSEKWQQLRDRRVCIISTKGMVTLPYAVLRHW